MEKLALQMPAIDLFGEQVIIQRRSFERRRKPAPVAPVVDLVQLAFLDILEMTDEELEMQRAAEDVTDDYIEWLRSYLLKLTLRQLLHRQVSEANRREAYDWLTDDSEHPFSFRVCCEAMETDYLEVREGVMSILRRQSK